MEVTFNIELSRSQQEVYDMVHDDKNKYITVVFSRQSGKTILMQCLCIEWLLEKGNSIAYICRNFILAKKLYRELIKILPKKLIKTSNGSDFFIESIYGSTLNFYSSEQGNSLRGQTFTHMICDEFAFHKQIQTDGTELWNDILSPTLKARGKKCIFVSTPLGKDIFYEMYQRGLSDDFPNCASILRTIYDDGFVTPQQLEEIRQSVPEPTFRREYMCEWMDDGISFFQGFSDCFVLRSEQVKGRCWCGIDCSGNGSDATILTRIDEAGNVKVFQIDGTLDMKYRQIAQLLNNFNPIATFIEINGLGAPMFNEIRKLVKNSHTLHEWTTTNASKEEIISNLAVAIAKHELHFLQDDELTYNELANFVVSISKSNKLIFQGKGTHDDRVMATAIALEAKRKNQLTTNYSFIRQRTTALR